MSRWQRAAWLAAFAVVFFLSFPQPVGVHVVDLGIAVAWTAPALLLLGLRGLDARAAARWAFGAGLAAHALVFSFLFVATVVYGEAPALVGVVAPIGLAIYPAFFFAVFGAAWAAGSRSAFAAAALWVALEHARSFVLTGFPWALLGYAQHDDPLLMALAASTGVWGASFATVLGGAALASGVDARSRGARIPRDVWLALAAVGLLHAAGAVDLVREDETPSHSVRVAVLQGNVDQAVKWSPAWADHTMSDYEALTRQAAAQGARVVLWPETAVPGSPDYSRELADRLAALATETQLTLVAGAVGVEPTRNGAVRYFDSAFVVAPDGHFADRYDKTHLVPFGEYVPLRDLLGHFVSAIARGAATTDVSAGRTTRALAIPLADGETLTAGVPICYELLFPTLVRRFVRDRGEALFAITNDAWYGRTGAPYQFLVMTAVRSAENRVWTARAANTGVSAIIDDRGRVRMQTELFEQTLLTADLPLRAGGSFYARHGDWFPAACWLATAAQLLAVRVRRRSR